MKIYKTEEEREEALICEFTSKSEIIRLREMNAEFLEFIQHVSRRSSDRCLAADARRIIEKVEGQTLIGIKVVEKPVPDGTIACINPDGECVGIITEIGEKAGRD